MVDLWFLQGKWLPQKWFPQMQTQDTTKTQPLPIKMQSPFSGISWVNKPTIGSQFYQPKWAEQTQVSNMKPEVKAKISKETWIWQPQISENIPVQNEMWATFKNITLDQENTLKTRLKQDFPDLVPEARLAKAQEIVSWWETKWLVKPAETEAVMQGWVKGWAARLWGTWWKGERINPIGKTVEELDNQIQKIGVVDFTADRETALQQRIATLTPSELQDYKQEREALKQNTPRTANLFQKTVKGKTLVWQMWNVITWDTKDLPQEEAFKNFVEEQEKSFVDQMVGVGTEWPKFANMMANIPWSALKTISAVARGMTNPVDTMVWLYKLIATPEWRQMLGERYGSWEWFAKTLESDPVWVASDILTVVEWGANIAKMWAKMAWATTTAAKIGKFAKTAWAASDLWVRNILPVVKSKILWTTKWTPVLKQVVKYSVMATEPLSFLTEWAKAVKGKLPSAEDTLQRMNRLTKWEQEKFQQQQGKNVGVWLNERWIVDTPSNTVAKLGEYFTENKAKVDEWLEKIQGKYTNEDIKLMSDDTVRYADSTRDPWLKRMQELNAKANWEWLEMKEVNELKRYFEQKNKFSYGRDLTAWEKTAWATNVDTAVRERQMKTAEENGFGNLREMNKETQWAKFIMDKLAKNENGRLGNNAITITDWIVAAPAMVEPSLLAWLVAKKVFGSNWFAKNYAKIINRINWHKNIANKVADLQTISKIQDEKAFQKWLDEGKQQSNQNTIANKSLSTKIPETKWLITKKQSDIKLNQKVNTQTKWLPSPETVTPSKMGTPQQPIPLKWQVSKDIAPTGRLRKTVWYKDAPMIWDMTKLWKITDIRHSWWWFPKYEIKIEWYPWYKKIEDIGWVHEPKPLKPKTDSVSDFAKEMESTAPKQTEGKVNKEWIWTSRKMAMDAILENYGIKSIDDLPNDIAKKVVEAARSRSTKMEAEIETLLKPYKKTLSSKQTNASSNPSSNSNSLNPKVQWEAPVKKAPLQEKIVQPVVRVKAPEELYHTSTQEIWKLTDDKVLRTTPDSKYTLKYGKEWSRNTYKVSSEWLNILDWTSKKWIDIMEGINKKLWDKWFSAGVISDDWKVISFVLKDKNIVAELKKMWYDWLRTTESSLKWWAESVWIINPSKIKWMEATKTKWLPTKSKGLK